MFRVTIRLWTGHIVRGMVRITVTITIRDRGRVWFGVRGSG